MCEKLPVNEVFVIASHFKCLCIFKGMLIAHGLLWKNYVKIIMEEKRHTHDSIITAIVSR